MRSALLFETYNIYRLSSHSPFCLTSVDEASKEKRHKTKTRIDKINDKSINRFDDKVK